MIQNDQSEIIKGNNERSQLLEEKPELRNKNLNKSDNIGNP